MTLGLYILNDMSLDEDILIRDVTNAGLVVSDRIGREVASQLDVEEALEASRYASHPYTTHPREVHCRSNSMTTFIFTRVNLFFKKIGAMSALW